MDRDELIRRLMVTFRAELEEHTRVFDRELLALERAPQGPTAGESIKSLFRAAHSLKGAARAVDAREIEAACHALEELLDELRNARRTLQPDVLAELFAAADKVAAAGIDLLGKQNVPPPVPPAFAPEPTTGVRSERASMVPPSVGAVQPVATQTHALEPEEMVRIPGQRLDTLLSQSGELLVSRRRFDTRRQDLDALQDLALRLRNDWRAIGLDAREPRRANGNGAHESNGGNGNNGSNGSHGANGQRAMSSRKLRAIAGVERSIARLERELERFTAAFDEDVRNLDRAAEPLQDQIRKARLLPFVEACEGLPRAVRDLARSQDKQAELVVEAEGAELDRSIIDGLRDPLLHLVRNAIDHGIEPVAERRAAGKPDAGRITIAAVAHGENVEVTVSDDGRGIDLDAVRARALELGLPTEGDELALARLVFTAGLSTAHEVTNVSGRGVGLDVVRTQIESMRGRVEITQPSGGGTRFSLLLPLTLSSLRVVFVRAGGEIVALPSSDVRRLMRVGPESLRSLQGKESLIVDGAPLPIVSLAGVLGLAEPAGHGGGKLPLVIIAADGRQAAFSVEELLGEQEVVQKSLGKRLGSMRFVSAATLLPNGQFALLLKPPRLIEQAFGETRSAPLLPRFATQAEIARKRILLVDDSVTTRTLERSILEAAGYSVAVATDGAAAWDLLKQQGADLILSDVEMPNMDGIELAQTVRASKRFASTPIVLLTALDSEQDRSRGLDAGADAYLVKGAFDQRALLETLRQLL